MLKKKTTTRFTRKYLQKRLEKERERERERKREREREREREFQIKPPVKTCDCNAAYITHCKNCRKCLL